MAVGIGEDPVVAVEVLLAVVVGEGLEINRVLCGRSRCGRHSSSCGTGRNVSVLGFRVVVLRRRRWVVGSWSVGR